MNLQQIVAFGLVAAAAIYIVYTKVRALRAIRAGDGCASGCGKCGSAGPPTDRRKAPANVIPLTEIRPVSHQNRPPPPV
jgi:hypothetical protein